MRIRRIGLILAFSVLACSKKDEAAPPTTTSSSPVVTAAEKGAPPGAVVSPALAENRAFDCGGEGQKPCPLQRWMKTVLAAATANENPAQLSQALSFVAGLAPPDMPNWATIAKDGAKRAAASDLDGAQESCKQCHDQYKAVYKRTMRDRPL